VLEVLCHHFKFGGAWTSPATEAAEFFCFIVCVSVMLLNDRDLTVEMNSLEYRNNFDTVG